MAKSKQFVLTIVVEPYTRYGDVSGTRVITYKGKDEKSVLLKIMRNHSYDVDGMDTMTVTQLVEQISEVNGDGCDLIVTMFEGEVKNYTKFQPIDLE